MASAGKPFVVHRPVGGWSLNDRCKVIVLRTLSIVARGGVWRSQEWETTHLAILRDGRGEARVFSGRSGLPMLPDLLRGRSLPHRNNR